MSQKNRSEKCFEEREVMKKTLISPQIEAYENTNIFSHNLEKQVVSLGKLSKKKHETYGIFHMLVDPPPPPLQHMENSSMIFIV